MSNVNNFSSACLIRNKNMLNYIPIDNWVVTLSYNFIIYTTDFVILSIKVTINYL